MESRDESGDLLDNRMTENIIFMKNIYDAYSGDFGIDYFKNSQIYLENLQLVKHFREILYDYVQKKK